MQASKLLVAAETAKIVIVLIVVLPLLVCPMTHGVTMMKTARWTPSKKSLAIRVSARTRAATMLGWKLVWVLWDGGAGSGDAVNGRDTTQVDM